MCEHIFRVHLIVLCVYVCMYVPCTVCDVPFDGVHCTVSDIQFDGGMCVSVYLSCMLVCMYIVRTM